MTKRSIQGLFTDICYNAIWDGYWVVSGDSIRKNRDHPSRQLGYYYNSLPEEIKKRLREELKSEHVQSPLRVMLTCGDVIPWDDPNKYRGWHKKEMLKFEEELMRHGWKPSFKF